MGMCGPFLMMYIMLKSMDSRTEIAFAFHKVKLSLSKGGILDPEDDLGLKLFDEDETIVYRYQKTRSDTNCENVD